MCVPHSQVGCSCHIFEASASCLPVDDCLFGGLFKDRVVCHVCLQSVRDLAVLMNAWRPACGLLGEDNFFV